MHDNSFPAGVPKERGPEARASARTNLFLAATLYSAGGAQPVKIRDLSTVGARLEGERVAEVGAAITLARGRLRVLGHVAWGNASHCGMLFNSPVSVRDWMAHPVNREQHRIDRVVGIVRAGAVLLEIPAARSGQLPNDLALDLRRVALLLGRLGDELAGDAVVAANYSVKLQYLDIASQTLSALAESVRTDDPRPAANMARLDDLRKSCAEALRAGV